MKPLILLIPILFLSCSTHELETTIVSAAFAYQHQPKAVSRMEIDIDSITYQARAFNVAGGLKSESVHLPPGTVARLVFYFGMDPVYEVKTQGWDKMQVCWIPFEYFGGDLGTQVFEINN
jgi:hypothetical protein